VADTSPGAKPGAKVADYWESSTKMLADPTGFLDSLMTYDKENIPPEVIKKIEPYIDREDFTVEAIARVSKACTSICMWARAMHTYYTVSVSVAPKRAALGAAQASLEVTMGELATAKATLKKVEDKLATLQKSFAEAMQKKEDLAAQVRGSARPAATTLTSVLMRRLVWWIPLRAQVSLAACLTLSARLLVRFGTGGQMRGAAGARRKADRRAGRREDPVGTDGAEPDGGPGERGGRRGGGGGERGVQRRVHAVVPPGAQRRVVREHGRAGDAAHAQSVHLESAGRPRAGARLALSLPATPRPSPSRSQLRLTPAPAPASRLVGRGWV
jgi:hypothetical protein